MGSQRIGHDLAPEQKQSSIYCKFIYFNLNVFSMIDYFCMCLLVFLCFVSEKANKSERALEKENKKKINLFLVFHSFSIEVLSISLIDL